MKPRVWLLSYDMADNRRRSRIAALALKHGERHQKSLYMMSLDYDQHLALWATLTRTVDAAKDRVLLRPVCRACQRGTRYQGSGGAPEQHEPFWIL